MKRAHNRQFGFTLIEVLVATMIFAVLIAAISTVLYSALNLRDDAQSNIQWQEALSLATTIMKRDFYCLAPPNENGLADALHSETINHGQIVSDRLIGFTASGLVQESLPFGDIQRVEYTLIAETNPQDEPGYTLVRYIYRNLLNLSAEVPSRIRLLRQVQRLQFRFWDGNTWQETWDEETQEEPMPLAIQTQITFAPPAGSENAPKPLSFVVPIHAKPLPSEETDETDTGGEGGNAQANTNGNQGGGGQPGGGRGGGAPGQGGR